MDFWTTPLGWTLATAGAILLVTVGILISLAFLLLADRKVWSGVQMAERVVFPKGQAKEDWAILRALSALVGHTLPYDTIDQLRTKLMGEHPTFGRIDYLPAPAMFDVASLGRKGDLGDVAFASPVRDPYLNNPIARASVTMAELSALRVAPVAMAAE